MLCIQAFFVTQQSSSFDALENIWNELSHRHHSSFILEHSILIGGIGAE